MRSYSTKFFCPPGSEIMPTSLPYNSRSTTTLPRSNFSACHWSLLSRSITPSKFFFAAAIFSFNFSAFSQSCSAFIIPSKSFLRFSRLLRASGFLSRRMISVPEARKTELGLMTALLALKFATRYCLLDWSSATKFSPEMPGPETMTSSTINAKLPRGPEIRLR